MLREIRQPLGTSVEAPSFLWTGDYYALTSKPYTVQRGDKISQLVVMYIALPTIKIVDELDETDRGNSGFGSTGK